MRINTIHHECSQLLACWPLHAPREAGERCGSLKRVVGFGGAIAGAPNMPCYDQGIVAAEVGDDLKGWGAAGALIMP